MWQMNTILHAAVQNLSAGPSGIQAKHPSSFLSHGLFIQKVFILSPFLSLCWFMGYEHTHYVL